jgi:hypothetical protein
MKQKINLKILLVLAAVLTSSLAIVGCKTYGSKMVMVTLKTVPTEKHARAFLVPIEEWAQITGGQDWMQPYTPRNPEAFRMQLEHCRVTSGPTPVTTEALPYRTVYVVEWQGRYQWSIVNLSRQQECSIELE